MFVISIQSQVVYGHVGNSASAYPIQAEGVNLAAVPTALLSNHPRYPTMRGKILDADFVADLLRGVEERGLIERAAVLVTGYLGSVEIAEVVARFVATAVERNPSLAYLCDPVIGDEGVGVFVRPGLEEIFRDRLVPLATVITPNQFELELLSHTPARDVEGLARACDALRPAVIATGCTLADTPAGQIETILRQAGVTSRFASELLPRAFCGTGDLLAGLTAAHLAKGQSLPEAVGRAVAGVSHVLDRTMEAGSQEMCLV